MVGVLTGHPAVARSQGLSVTIESVPDPGHKIAAEIKRMRSADHVSESTESVSGQLRRAAAVGSAAQHTCMSLVFDGRQGKDRRSVEDVAAEIGAQLPEIVGALLTRSPSVLSWSSTPDSSDEHHSAGRRARRRRPAGRAGVPLRRVGDWFPNLLAPTLVRRLDAAGAGTLTWCPRWWAHAEAIAQLEALWRAWEICRDADGEAPARWFWQHCDPILAVLVDAKVGPLSDCTPDQHRKYTSAQTLPFEPAPPGYWGTANADQYWAPVVATLDNGHRQEQP